MATIAPTTTTSVGITLAVLEVTNLNTQESTQVQSNTKIIQPSTGVTCSDPGSIGVIMYAVPTPTASTSGQQTSQTYWITG